MGGGAGEEGGRERGREGGREGGRVGERERTHFELLGSPYPHLPRLLKRGAESTVEDTQG